MDVIKGSRPERAPVAKPNRIYEAERVCTQEGCETRLSVYNKATFCWSHTPTKYPGARGERRRRPAA
jgi:hypothetical protein